MSTFCGFNGFSQFGSAHGRKVTKFAAFTVPAYRPLNDEVLISATWSYTAFAAGSQLCLKGFLQEAPNSSLTVTTAAVIKQLATCDRFCLALLVTGQLFKIAPKTISTLQELKFAALEENDGDCHHSTKRSIFGEIRSSVPNFKITHIACGEHLACAISSTNAVYNIPSKIHQLPKHLRVLQLVCGFEHALILTGNGDVYAWGNGLRGQLGHQEMAVTQCPTLIDALAGIKITHISAGGWHSAAISAFGDLYTWGFNPNGQLGLRVFKEESGLKNPTVFPLPQLIDLPKCCESKTEESSLTRVEECAPLRVFTGARHSILQMSCGAVFVCGWNAHGQLGLGSKIEFVDEFCKIECIANKTNIICGTWCTIFKEK